MAEAPEYKPTLFDRHGPHAAEILRAWGYGLMVFGLTIASLLAKMGFRWWTLPVCAAAGAIAGASGYALGSIVARGWKRVTVDGATTPYRGQYSYQEVLVMQGRVDDAVTSYEAVIAEQPAAVLARTKAAELYARSKNDPERAAELFRQVLRIETASAGDIVYATNRLVDLLAGPLGDPGTALVELRRFINRHPQAPAAEHARQALAALRLRVHGASKP